MADAVVCVKVLPSIVLTCLFQGLLLDEPQLYKLFCTKKCILCHVTRKDIHVHAWHCNLKPTGCCGVKYMTLYR